MGIFSMTDSLGRTIDYMRISITDRCNLRCNYCMPESGIESFPMSDILTYEEIVQICTIVSEHGISRIRITGGEPLVRKDAPKLVGMIKNIPGIKEVNITTNGLLLNNHLQELTDMGIDGINISLDSADKDRYRMITGRDAFEQVEAGILASVRAGIRTKINTVLLNDVDYKGIFRFAEELPIDVRFIELMPIGLAKNMQGISHEQVLEYIDSVYPGREWSEDKRGNGPAKYLNIPDFTGKIGLISPIHGKFCDKCNRIRLTATGTIKPCLCYGQAIDVKSSLRNKEYDEVTKLIRESIMNKPAAHIFEDEKKVTEKKSMVSIGG